jgi:hypothetical protein
MRKFFSVAAVVLLLSAALYSQLPSGSGSSGSATLTRPQCFALVCGDSIVRPVADDFTWVNQGTATKIATADYVGIKDTDAGGDQVRMLVKSTPATPFTITAAFYTSGVGGGSWGYSGGLVLRQSSDGKLIVIGRSHVSGASYFLLQSFTNATTWSANQAYITSTSSAMSHLHWVRYVDNGTNRYWYLSVDGINFNELKNESRTTFLTANQIGLYVDAFDSNASTTLVYWKQE